jgi:hypothetical protein
MTTEQEWLTAHGYGLAVHDACWLDCANPDGHLKVYRGQEICLCLAHALILEAGKVGGSYRGALLPAPSVAAEWPWRPAQPVPVVVQDSKLAS